MIPILIYVLIFTIILVIVVPAVGNSLNIYPPALYILSICVSLLAVLSLQHEVGAPVDGILLPYVALAIAILLTILLAIIIWIKRQSKKYFTTRNLRLTRLKDYLRSKNKNPNKHLKR